MNAELVTTGAELLSGRSVNTHAQRLAQALEPLGIALSRDTTVPDDRAAIADAVRSALTRVELAFVSGGLGPTCDDVTREAVADVVGRPIVRDAATLAALRTRYERMGRTLTDSRARQADVIEGATVLSNTVGAAPGQIVVSEGRKLVILPGPPREFEAIVSDHVLPWLRATWPHLRPAPCRYVLLCGVAESDVVETFAAQGFDPGALELAYCASPGSLEVRLTGRPGMEAEVEAAIARVRTMLAPHLYAEERVTLASVVGGMLRAAGATVAVAESCTGGLLGRKLTDAAGSSDYFLGGAISYANAAKTTLLGVPAPLIATHGAVSEEVARAMAEGIRERLGASYGLAVTGIAGPGGGSEAKPVGTVWIGLAGPGGTEAGMHRFSGDRGWIREWAAQYALDRLRRRLAAR